MAVDPQVFPYAMQIACGKGAFNPALWADVLLWPRARRKSPMFWTLYCEHWADQHEIPVRLSGLAVAGTLHVICGAMSADAGRFNCFVSMETIAKRAHVCERTVRRIIDWQKDAPSPLIEVSRPGQTRGMLHGSCRFSIVLDPPAFAKARDAARASHREQAGERLLELRPEKLKDQQALILGQMSREEYDARQRERENQARGRLPKTVPIAEPAPKTWRPKHAASS